MTRMYIWTLPLGRFLLVAGWLTRTSEQTRARVWSRVSFVSPSMSISFFVKVKLLMAAYKQLRLTWVLSSSIVYFLLLGPHCYTVEITNKIRGFLERRDVKWTHVWTALGRYRTVNILIYRIIDRRMTIANSWQYVTTQVTRNVWLTLNKAHWGDPRRRYLEKS